jgi:hypothetical protein
MTTDSRRQNTAPRAQCKPEITAGDDGGGSRITADDNVVPIRPDLLNQLEVLITYFRTDVHAVRFWDDKRKRWSYKPVEAALTKRHLAAHLTDGPHLGTYVIPAESDKVRSAVFDLDDHNGEVEWPVMVDWAKRITAALKAVKLNAWPVRSGGGRGIHIYLFWNDPVSAAAVRYTMEVVLESVGLEAGEDKRGLAAGKVEVFPKQGGVGVDDFGNLIALPYGRDSVPLDRYTLEPVEKPQLWQMSADPLEEPPPEEEEPAQGDVVERLVIDALRHLDPGIYSLWVQIGHALKYSLKERGLPIWMEWSKRWDEHPGDGEIERKWAHDLRPRGRVKVGTIFWLAAKAGWKRPDVSDRPIIQIKSGEIERTIDAAEAALLRSDGNIYRHGNRVVRVVHDIVNVRGGKAEALRFHRVETALMNERFSSAARFLKFDGRKGKFVRCDVPEVIGKTYLARGQWRLPPIVGIVTAPTIRPDGSILDRPGYDEATGLYLDTLGVSFPEVSGSPSKVDALDALERLKHPIRLFNFKTNADKSVELSFIITGVVRASVKAAPLHGFDAPVAGSGKGKLVAVAAIIATGGVPQVIGHRSGRFGVEEFDKQLSASILGGAASVSIDNLDVPLDSALLCTALTESQVTIRRFGTLDDNITVPCTTMFSANGNNLTLVGDLTRRSLVCTLDPQCERPELREFDEDPVEVVRMDRPRMVVDALTVVLAYGNRVKDDFVPPPPLGSYEEWSTTVRDALVWLGEDDPVETMEKVRGADPVLESVRTVMNEWQATVGCGVWVRLRDVTAKAEERYELADTPLLEAQGQLKNEALREALIAVARGSQGEIDTNKLAGWLRRKKDRVVGGRRFVVDPAGTHGAQWMLEAVK